MHTPPGWNCGRGRSDRDAPGRAASARAAADPPLAPRKRSPSAHHAPPSDANLEALASRLATDRSGLAAFWNGSQVSSHESLARR